jgi:hypothetical protein
MNAQMCHPCFVAENTATSSLRRWIYGQHGNTMIAQHKVHSKAFNQRAFAYTRGATEANTPG